MPRHRHPWRGRASSPTPPNGLLRILFDWQLQGCFQVRSDNKQKRPATGPRFLSSVFFGVVFHCYYATQSCAQTCNIMSCAYAYVRACMNIQTRAFLRLHIHAYLHAQTRTCAAYVFALPWYTWIRKGNCFIHRSNLFQWRSVCVRVFWFIFSVLFQYDLFLTGPQNNR